MAFSQIVKTLVQPSIKMITLSDYDTSSEGTPDGVIRQGKSYADSSQTVGAVRPFVKIGGRSIVDIDHLIIDETEFIPKLTLIFTDIVGEFSGNTFPKRNLMASVYIAADNGKFKPVRSDYLITSVKTIPSTRPEDKLTLSNNMTYLIKAELFVPRLYNNVSRSYANQASSETLKKVCSELGLGYAQNDFSNSDKMTWININTSPLNFMKEITNYAYQDDASFFSGFINKELIFNFINVNEQLKDIEPDKTFSTAINPMATNLTQKQKTNTDKANIQDEAILNFLTNRSQNVGKSNHIVEANLISKQGEILKADGYLKKIFYYDHFEPIEDKKLKSFYTAPINSDGADELTMLTPDDEGLAEIGNKKWMNINYGNTHENWNAARVFNTHNLKELEKIKLRVVTNGINFQAVRGSSIPVIMTLALADAIRKEADPDNPRTNTEKEKLQDEVLDTQLSGRYYVSGVKYHYDPTQSIEFSTELFLARREWNPSKIIFTANA